MKWLLIITWLNGGDVGPHVETIDFTTEASCLRTAVTIRQAAARINAEVDAFNANPPPAVPGQRVRLISKAHVEVPHIQCVPQ